MKIYNICDYDAKYSDQVQTSKIQAAIDDCFLAGGGRVLIPCGTYRTGGLRLRSGVELYLESGAILEGSRDPEDYFGWTEDPIEPVTMEEIVDGNPKKGRSAVCTSRWCNGLIRAIDAHDIAVIGEKGSYIDGMNCFDPEGEEKYRGPHGMSIWRCKNIRLEGYTFKNSSNWCHAIFQSQNITMKNVAVFGGHDGFDVRTCDNVLVENCEFQCGDDCIAGYDNNDVTVRNCILNSACQAIRFGGNHVLIENCRSDERPLRFPFRLHLTEEEKKNGALTNDKCRHEMTVPFSYYCDHRATLRKPAENMIIRNCDFSQAKELVRLEFDGLHRWCCNRSLKEITFENCTVNEIIRAGMMWGSRDEKVSCTFRNMTIRAKEGFGDKVLFVAANFEKIVFENCVIEGYDEPTILVATDDKVEIIRSTPIKVQKATWDECLDEHPWGVVPEDRAKMRTFSLTPDSISPKK